MSIDSVPTFNFYKDGEIVDAMFGANVSNLEGKLNDLTGVQEKEDEAVEEKEDENDVVTPKEEPAPEESTPEESEKAPEEAEEGEKREFTLKVLDLEEDESKQ